MTSLIPRDPFFGALLDRDPFSRLSDLFDLTMDVPFVRNRAASRVSPHAYSLREESDLVTYVDIPGVDPTSGVSVKVTGKTLVINTVRKWEHDTEDAQGEKKSTYAVSLPRPASPDDVEASVTNGVLAVRVKGAYVESPDDGSFEVPVSIGASNEKPAITSEAKD